MSESLREYLRGCCERHGFVAMVVADAHGMTLAHEGESMGDAFVAHLPVWLESGDRVSKMGGLGGSLCCCVLPANRAALMLAWQASRENGEKLFFAVLTRQLPARLGSVLEDVGRSLCRYIDQASTLPR